MPESQSVTVDEKTKIEIEACAKEVALIKAGKLGPKPPFTEEVIKNDLKYKLIDPFSAQYDIGKPRRGAVLCGPGSDPDGYWMVPVLVNAKNKLGAYAGWKTYIYNWTNVGGKLKWSPEWFEFTVKIRGMVYRLEEEEAQAKVMRSIIWVDE